MDTAAKPIVATTSLSFLLHGVAFAGMLLVFERAVTQDQGVGSGVEIQLVSSVLVSDQEETEAPSGQQAVKVGSSESEMHAVEEKVVEDIVSSLNSPRVIADAGPDKKELVDANKDQQQNDIRQEKLSVEAGESLASITQSTNASQQQHAILELLHRRISDNKEYPYLARRQRREGIATVAFVLHPDGRVENAHLVTSSRAAALDRAALSAVKQIEPFTVAHEYIEQSEAFQVDVEFDLL